MTQGEGQARIPMTGLLLTEKPNLEGPHTDVRRTDSSGNQLTCVGAEQPYLSLRTTPSIQAPKKTTLEMSEHQVKAASIFTLQRSVHVWAKTASQQVPHLLIQVGKCNGNISTAGYR